MCLSEAENSAPSRGKQFDEIKSEIPEIPDRNLQFDLRMAYSYAREGNQQEFQKQILGFSMDNADTENALAKLKTALEKGEVGELRIKPGDENDPSQITVLRSDGLMMSGKLPPSRIADPTNEDLGSTGLSPEKLSHVGKLVRSMHARNDNSLEEGLTGLANKSLEELSELAANANIYAKHLGIPLTISAEDLPVGKSMRFSGPGENPSWSLFTVEKGEFKLRARTMC